ncbi:MAG: hypothetical protein WDN00_10215 [Limisphaerales bacterium]
MKTKNILLAIVCSLSMSAAAQDTSGGSQVPGSDITGQNIKRF